MTDGDREHQESLRREAEEVQRAAREQAERMAALPRGEPDPHPEQDAEAAERLADEFMADEFRGKRGQGEDG